MSNIKNKIDQAKKNLPYTFIPIENDKNANKDKKGNSKQVSTINFNEQKGVSGSLQCTLQVLNGLIVGNEHDDKTIKPPCVEKNEKLEYLISPYTLKGCIRQFIASLTNAPMRQVENEAFFYRPNQFFKNNDSFGIAAGIVDEIKKDGSIEATKINPPYCFTRKDNKDRRGNKIVKLNRDWNYRTRISRQKIDVWFQDRNGDKLHFVPYRDGIDGYASFSKLFGKPKSHDAFGYLTKNITTKKVTASSSIVSQYNAIPELIIKYHMPNHPNIKDENLIRNNIDKSTLKKNIRKEWELKTGDLILYEYDTKTNEILSFGKHFRYLWSYKNRIWDFDEVCIVDVENFKKDLLFVTDEMFGYSFSNNEKKYVKENFGFDLDKKKDGKPIYKTSKSGKIHFNFAKYVENSGIIDKEFKVPGTDSPHASSYEFYLQQDKNKKGNEILNNYGDRFEKESNSHLSGRKIYKRSTKYEENINKFNGHIDSVKTTLFKSENNKIAKFKFTVNFENLSKEELKLLLFALTFGKNIEINKTKDVVNQYCHQIGYAKNFGLGAVRILVDNISVISRNKDKFFIENKKIKNYEFSQLIQNFNKKSDNFKLTEKKLYYPHINGQIFKWHSKIRKEDHENRKKYYKSHNRKVKTKNNRSRDNKTNDSKKLDKNEISNFAEEFNKNH